MEHLLLWLMMPAHLVLSPLKDKDILPVEVTISSEDMSLSLTSQSPLALGKSKSAKNADIVVNEDQTYQSIVGLGSSLEHSTCYNISKLPLPEQEKVVESIVDPVKGIGMNLMRICIGTPDFTASPWYSYDDVPRGAKDPELSRFSISRDQEYVLPILKMALAKNPDLLFIAAPWSPPAWMKRNDELTGGAINPECFDAFARYLARFVKAYEAEGIPILSVTPQNEPRMGSSGYTTCKWTGEEQRDFIRDFLGPEFQRQGIATKIWCWDHNFDLLDFPRTILKDAQAASFVEGTAFHHYGGKAEAMTTFHGEFPQHNIYFTEGSTFGVRGAQKIIRFLRNWARSYNAWVTIIDHKRQPNPGPHGCGATCIVLNSENLTLDYRFDYYMYGQFMKFIQRDAVRIESSEGDDNLANVAFRNPDGSIVLVVVNAEGGPRTFSVAFKKNGFTAIQAGRSVATYRWKEKVSEN